MDGDDRSDEEHGEPYAEVSDLLRTLRSKDQKFRNDERDRGFL
jgi:hypothetical protein